jgi:hypothetical protein
VSLSDSPHQEITLLHFPAQGRRKSLTKARIETGKEHHYQTPSSLQENGTHKNILSLPLPGMTLFFFLA